MCYDSEPVHPGPHPSRKDGLLAQDPKGGDGDRELLRFSKRRCEIEPGARDAPISAREGASLVLVKRACEGVCSFA